MNFTNSIFVDSFLELHKLGHTTKFSFLFYLDEATTPNKPEDDVVPIIVGSVLSAIIVVVIAWYIVIRIRNKKKMKN